MASTVLTPSARLAAFASDVLRALVDLRPDLGTAAGDRPISLEAVEVLEVPSDRPEEGTHAALVADVARQFALRLAPGARLGRLPDPTMMPALWVRVDDAQGRSLVAHIGWPGADGRAVRRSIVIAQQLADAIDKRIADEVMAEIQRLAGGPS